MEVKIINERENPLMKRREILATINYQGGSTPSKAELQKLLADQLKANIENIEISKIMSETGLSKGKAWIKVWQEKKVPIYAELKKKEEAPKPETEAKTEEIKEEVKTEEKSETPKEEEKKE